MFKKSKFIIKRFVSSSSYLKTTFPPFKYRKFLPFSSPNTPTTFQFLSNSSLLTSPFCSFLNSHQNKYKEDIALLKGLSQEQLTKIHPLFEKYAVFKDLRAFSSEEIELIISTLQQLSNVYLYQSNINQASSYLLEAEEICKELNIKDTKEVARGHFMRATHSLFFQKDLSETEGHLEEAERICKSFGNDDKLFKVLLTEIPFMRASLYAIRNENDKALNLLNSVFEKINDVVQRIPLTLLFSAFLHLGRDYVLKKEYGKAEECLSKGLKAAIDRCGERSQLAFQFSLQLVKVFYMNGKSEKAFSYAKKNLQIALEIFAKDSEEVARCYAILGYAYLINHEFDKALDPLETAIKGYEKLPQNDPTNLSELYYSTSMIYYMQRELKKASALLIQSNKVLDAANFEKDPNVSLEFYSNRGKDLINQGRWDEAEDYLRKALKICQDSDPINKLKIVDIYFFLGEVAYEKEHWKTALQYFKETEKPLQECSAESFKIYLLHSYLGVLHIITKDYDKGINYLEKATESCEVVEDIGFLMCLYICLIKVYNHQGMQKEQDEILKKFEKHTGKFHQKHPDIQVGMHKARRIFWTIISSKSKNQL